MSADYAFGQFRFLSRLLLVREFRVDSRLF